MNNREKVRSAYMQFDSALKDMDTLEAEIERLQNEGMREKQDAIDKAKENLKRVLHGVYGEKDIEVLVPLDNQEIVRVIKQGEHVGFAVMRAEVV